MSSDAARQSSFSSGSASRDDDDGLTVVGAPAGSSVGHGNNGTDVGRTAQLSRRVDELSDMVWQTRRLSAVARSSQPRSRSTVVGRALRRMPKRLICCQQQRMDVNVSDSAGTMRIMFGALTSVRFTAQ